MAYSKQVKAKFEAYEKEIQEKDKKIKELEYENQDLKLRYKYCLFDLEATRREKEYLRRIVDGEK